MNDSGGYKEKIADCALDIITKEGYKNMSIANIAKRCSISKTTFYRFFASKEALLEYLKEKYEKEHQIAVDMKEQIIIKAVEYFQNNYFSDFDLESIAKVVGLTRTSIYKYFSSKDELLEACIQFEIRKRQSFIEALEKNINDPIDSIRRLAEYAKEYSRNRFNNCLIATIKYNALRDKKYEEYINELLSFRISTVARALEKGKKTRVFRSDMEVHTMAEIIVSFLNGFHLTAQVVNLDNDINIFLEMLFQNLLHGKCIPV